MVFLEFILIALAALLIGVLFYYVFRSTGPWGNLWSILLILILAGLAADAWITPVGPYYQGVSWFPVLFVILLFAFLIAATTPVRRRNGDPVEEESSKVALGVSFWFLMFLLLIAVLWGLLL